MTTRVWGNPEKAKILVIGHDPRLQKSLTIADYCFFADYYFKPIPVQQHELKKYQLAESLFQYIRYLTNSSFGDNQILITNLCNDALESPGKGRTVYIPPEKARSGLTEIRNLLREGDIRIIFAMSQQVNYWLQKLGFCQSNEEFLIKAEPKLIGVNNYPPYYQPKKSGAFMEICGRNYLADSKYYVFPVIHVKSYPPKGRFLGYEKCLEDCKERIKKLLSTTGLNS